MHSSISSSRDRLWARTWCVTIGLLLLFLGSWEIFWRARGFRPAIVDDKPLWALGRRSASRAGDGAVVIVGSSRMLVGINPDALAAATGWSRPIQLGIARGPSLPVLRNLSGDFSFTGKVICGVNVSTFFDANRALDRIASEHLSLYKNFSWADALNQRLRMVVQQNLIFRHPALSPKRLGLAFLRGEWPRLPHLITTAGRFTHVDFSRFEQIGLRNRMVAFKRQLASGRSKPFTPGQLDEFMNYIEWLVMKIRSRGGDVIFVRMPTSAYVRKDEARNFPRNAYWDLFAGQSTALTVHFEDYPELSEFTLPDGGHLDGRDAITFTGALGRIISDNRERGGKSRPAHR